MLHCRPSKLIFSTIGGYHEGSVAISLTDVCLFIWSFGSVEATLFDRLLKDDRDDLCSALDIFVIGIADVIGMIRRDEKNSFVGLDSLPLLLSTIFAAMTPSIKFHSRSRFFCYRLKMMFSQAYITSLQEECLELHLFCLREEPYRVVHYPMSSDDSFLDAWVSVQFRFPKLCEFVIGLPTLYLETLGIDGDFSITC